MGNGELIQEFAHAAHQPFVDRRQHPRTDLFVAQRIGFEEWPGVGFDVGLQSGHDSKAFATGRVFAPFQDLDLCTHDIHSRLVQQHLAAVREVLSLGKSIDRFTG